MQRPQKQVGIVHGGSRFARLVPMLAFLYVVVLSLILLYPYEFSSPFASSKNSVKWLDNAEGVQFGHTGMLASAAPPTSLHRRLTSGEGLTIEVWLTAASANQGGPARILSYSANPWQSNFTVGQVGRDLIIRLRTGRTDGIGRPSLEVSNALVPKKKQHIVVTYNFREERVYVDGRLRIRSAKRQGQFETWDSSFRLVFGNELSGARPWSGTIVCAAIYDRPMPANVVAVRHKADCRPSHQPAAGPLASFNFQKGLKKPQNISGRADAFSLLPLLESPAQVPMYSRLFFSSINGKIIFDVFTSWDVIQNIILFVPLGCFGFAFAAQRTQSMLSAILITVVGACLISGMFEALQFFLDKRSSSIFDLGANVAGALVGAATIWALSLQVERK